MNANKALTNKVLMLAYHFPPLAGSSGVQRTIAFARHLPEFNWQPLVLSANPRAFERQCQQQLEQLPNDLYVKRAFALDTARHLAISGRYLSWMALPDRQVSWVLGAVPTALAMIKAQQPQVLWSTYPIASAHLIGLILKRLTGLPWVADFRDSMTEANYPRDPRQRRVYQWLERQVIEHCDYAVFTTSGAKHMYAQRYPHLSTKRWHVISNGYDEASFMAAEKLPTSQTQDGIKRLVHAGIIYPSERDPSALFAALAQLKASGEITADNFQLVLRATGHDSHHQSLLEQAGISELVELAAPLPYQQTLREMLDADGLLLLQAANCNHQIPAKAYEYLRAGQPIIALTDPAGNTAELLADNPNCLQAPLDEVNAITTVLRQWLAKGTASQTSNKTVNSHQYSRQYGSGQLAQLFNQLALPSTCE